MAVVPTFGSILVEARQSFGLARLSSKKQDKLANFEMSLDSYLTTVDSGIEAIFDVLELDRPARVAARSNLANWSKFQQALANQTWTFNASIRQVVWSIAVFSHAPVLGRFLANWNLEKPADAGMPGGEFWYLPRVDERTNRVTQPVEHVVRWLMDLLGLPMDKAKLALGGKRAKRKCADAYDSMERSLYNWLAGKIPRVLSIDDYFPDDANLSFRGVFDVSDGTSPGQRFAAALDFCERKGILDADALRAQIPMTQLGRIEAVLARDCTYDEQQEFVRLLLTRYAKPDMRTIRQRLRVARAVQDGYQRLVKFLCPGADPACADPYQNKVLQLIGIIETIYNLTVDAYKYGSTQADEDAWFESRLPPWDKETILLSIVPSRYSSADSEVAEMLTRQFIRYEPSDALIDWVPMDEPSVSRITESKLSLIRELVDTAGRTKHLLDRTRSSSPWRAFQQESDYWTVSQVVQNDAVSIKAREMGIQRMRELASSPREIVGTIVIELGALLNSETKLRPKDVEQRVGCLLDEAASSSAYSEYEAAILQYRAKHSLARNDFPAAISYFREALGGSAIRNCGHLIGEVSRDLLAVLVVAERLGKRGSKHGELERPFRHMRASGMIEGFDITLSQVADAIPKYFWGTLYKPYPGYPTEKSAESSSV